MFRSCLKSTVGLVALIAAGPASAADFDPPPMEQSSCFYVRADVAGVFHERPSVSKSAIGPGGGFWGASTEAQGETIEDTVAFEGGFGCQIVENLRVELSGGVRLRQSLEDGFNSLNAEIQTYTAFANVFYDITNYGGWTPYIGGGVGIAYHDINDVVAPIDSSPGNQVDFAWNIQAGVSYDLTPNAKLDLGYRLIDLGVARSDGPVPFKVKDLMAHEFKVGFRYHFGAW